MSTLVYLFERFPSFTQTFCYREVSEVRRQGMELKVYVLREREETPSDADLSLDEFIHRFPEQAETKEVVRQWLDEKTLPLALRRKVDKHWPEHDRQRLFEAIWLGQRLPKGCHVHAHFAGMAARTAYWLKLLYGIPFSFTGHANDIFCEKGEAAIPLSALVEEATFIVGEAEYTRRWLMDRFPAHAHKMRRVHNGIHVEAFTPAQPDLQATPEVVSVGRCVEKKGYSDLLDACALLRDEGVDYRCTIIGGGPLEAELREKLARLDLQDRVTMTGPLPEQEVNRHLRRATLFALACVTEQDGGKDNLPTVIAEAMASSLPVVSTRLAGVPEMVLEGENGLLVQERDVPALANAMKTILCDRPRAAAMGARGREIAQERFSLEVTGKHLKGYFEEALQQPRGSWWKRWLT